MEIRELVESCEAAVKRLEQERQDVEWREWCRAHGLEDDRGGTGDGD